MTTTYQRPTIGLRLAILAALVGLFASVLTPVLVRADNVQDDVVAGGNDTFTAGASTTVMYRIAANSGDGQAGCNVLDGSSATVTINKPAAVTASPSSLVFSSCGTDEQVVFSSATPGDYSITVSVSDSGVGSYNTSPAAFTLHVLAPADSTPPVLSLPASITAEATGPAGAAVSYTASASDAVDGPRPVNCSPASGSTFPLGTTTVNCSAADTKGNTANGSFTVSVQDTTGPTVTVPASITGVEATGPTGAVVSYGGQSATDLVDGSRPVSCTPPSGSTFGLGTTTVTCTATDTRGNVGNATFTITVQDTTGPVLFLPGDITAEATGPLGATVTYSASATDAVDGDVAIDCGPVSGSTFPLGTQTVTCSAVDAAGTVTVGAFTVIVGDTTPPAVTVPADTTVEATGPSGAAVTYTASASDLVDGVLAPTCTSASGGVFPLGITTITCSATDAAGNTGSNSFTITVEDTTAPSLNLPDDITVEATGSTGAVVTFVATATDLVDGAVNVNCDPASGATFSLDTTAVNCSATDSHGNTATGSFFVTVEDTTAPVLDLPDAQTLEATGPLGTSATYAASAVDLVDGGVAVVCDPASGSTFPLGTTTVECSATDASGNTATGSFTITVQDTTAPDVADVADITFEATGPAGAVVTFDTPTATDAVSGSPAVTCDPESGSTYLLGTTIVTCSATDGAGNTGTSEFTVTVTDTTAPALALPAAITEEATGPTGAAVTFAASASDLVDGAVLVNCIPPSGTVFALGTTTVACTSTDAAGNDAAGSFSVTVQDTTAPVLTAPIEQIVEATGPGGAIISFTASAVDLVDGTVLVNCDVASGDSVPLGTTTVTCSATDAAGNTGTRSFTVTVVDTTPPSLTLPSNITTDPTGHTGAAVSFSASASDVVDGTVPVTCNPISGSTFGFGTTTISCSATDAAGNMASGSFTVTVSQLSRTGFYAPVTMDGSKVNTVKGGSTVPLKFEVFAGSTEVTNTAVVGSFSVRKVNCTSGDLEDPVDFTTTGGTSLRYDTTAGQFVQNWQTPKTPGCYQVTLRFASGSAQPIVADFMVK